MHGATSCLLTSSVLARDTKEARFTSWNRSDAHSWVSVLMEASFTVLTATYNLPVGSKQSHRIVSDKALCCYDTVKWSFVICVGTDSTGATVQIVSY